MSAIQQALVEQAQINQAIQEYMSFVAEHGADLDDATEKLLRFIGRCLRRKGELLVDLRWHSAARTELCAALDEAQERQTRAFETARHLFATLPYSTDELALRVGDLLTPLVRGVVQVAA